MDLSPGTRTEPESGPDRWEVKDAKGLRLMVKVNTSTEAFSSTFFLLTEPAERGNCD